MRDEMTALFTRPPLEIVDGVWDYGVAGDGDCYSDEDETRWLNGGTLAANWARAFDSPSAWPEPHMWERAFARGPRRLLDICCGPGMGFVPRVLAQYPEIRCLAMDASSRLMRAQRKALDEPLRRYHLSLASFSALNMPLRDGSFDVVTSNLGIGSTRSGQAGRLRAAREVHRVLRDDGWFVAVENTFDWDAARKVFELWGQPPWDDGQMEMPWERLWEESGFTCASPPCQRIHYLTGLDNDLGEQAEKFGVRIGVTSTLYLLRKA